ncbi:hypothetical protein Ae201684P_017986 [Aphanomyces euteiches]|nr:hypothetical protein Ae201684P_017986 [Aphanomyces euteiches]KAH9151530.1 hypothetical protein AeRB84_005873 [Aphanomyces euteiches]
MPRKRSGEGALGAEDAAAVAASLRAKRIRPSTKKAYDSKMNEILSYVKTNFPVVFMDDQPQLPLPKAAVLSFFSNLAKGAHDCDVMDSSVDNRVMSLSHVESFRSALVNFYRNKSIELQPDVNAELNSFLQGYAKTKIN